MPLEAYDTLQTVSTLCGMQMIEGANVKIFFTSIIYKCS
jgi:hypothetical protein